MIRLRLQLGSMEPDDAVLADWDKTVSEFPSEVSHRGSEWAHEYYQEDDSGRADWMLYFSREYSTSSKLPPRLLGLEGLSVRHDAGAAWRCECGAHATKFPQGHSHWCPAWLPLVKT